MGRARGPLAAGRVRGGRECTREKETGTGLPSWSFGKGLETERPTGNTGIHGNPGIMLNVGVPSCTAARPGSQPSS